jgi:hypothetical protein
MLSKEQKHLRTSLKWNKEHPERFKQIKKEYRLRNLEIIKEKHRRWRESPKGRIWMEKYRKEYHNRPEVKKHYKEYMEKWHIKRREKIMGSPKPSICPVCKRGGIRICMDHNHKTGKMRGWLCDKCNVTLGRVDDSPKILLALIKYLNETS